MTDEPDKTDETDKTETTDAPEPSESPTGPSEDKPERPQAPILPELPKKEPEEDKRGHAKPIAVPDPEAQATVAKSDENDDVATPNGRPVAIPDPQLGGAEPIEPVAPVVAASADGGGPRAVWRRIREGLQPSRGQAIVAVVLGLVAFLAVVQVRQNLADDGYANARREDLIEILDGLGQSTRRLESEISELEDRKTKLSSGADRAANARTQAEEQIKVLGILAGTLPAQGPGVRITLTDPNAKIESGNLLDAIEELRDAGAESIQINGKVRVVASTDFTDDPPGIRIDGETLQPPYVIEAIGDSHNLSEAANFPGGLVSEITGAQINGTAEVTEVKTLRITALHTPQEHRYARPAASPTK